MLTINKLVIKMLPEDKFHQQEQLNRLSDLYKPTGSISHHVTWHLEHKYSQLRNKPAYFYHKYILLSPAPVPPWFGMNKEYFWTQVPVFT
jgi:hypothetical protein